MLKYDQAYRKVQAASGFKWGADNSFFMQLYLKPDQDRAASSYAKKRPGPKSRKSKFDPDTGNPICIKWNTTGGCTFRECKFSHRCMLCFSSAHPQHACNSNGISGNA